MRSTLGSIVERLQLQLRIAAMQRRREQVVAKLRVFRQNRTVAVRAEDVLIAHALKAVLPVVAAAGEHLAERRHAAAEVGLAAVVFKADNQTAAGLRQALEERVADHALLRPDGVIVDRADEITLLAVPRAVVAAEHLIAAADGQKRLAVGNGSLDLAALSGAQIGQEHLLLKVLTAADEKQIKLCEICLLADRDPRHLGVDAAPLEAAAQTQEVAPVAVEVQKIRVQMADAQGLFAHSQNSFPPSCFCSRPRRSSMAV